MTILPLHPAENATPDALRGFLEQCRSEARRRGRAQLVSISLAVEALDPLAVLESIFDPDVPHFYTERPGLESAIAGAEIAVSFSASGPRRFEEVQRWMDETLDHTIAVGDVDAPFGGPHFFAAFTFEDRVEETAPFAAAYAFVPIWQVARAGATTTAVANFAVAPEADLAPLVERVWRAHAKFRKFEYGGNPELGELTGEPPPAAAGKAAWNWSEVGDYRGAVGHALERIADGELKKIVLARALDVVAPEPFHPLRMLNGLRQRYPDCYSFSFTAGTGRSFIGATPERLVRVSRGGLETEALAGSIRRGTTASEDAALASALEHSEKDRREHQTVFDDIISRLRPLQVEPEYPAEPCVRRLANVQHLHTPIRANLPGAVRALDVVAALHPTPAVGGIPREPALQRIHEFEGFTRGLYAGTLGWLNARGGGEFFVGIRSAVIEGNRARVFAGAGIVTGSTPEKEFAETELKFRAILDAFRDEER